MAKSYRAYAPFDVAMKLLKPTTTMVKGVTKKVYPDPSKVEDVFFGSFRTYGGTENFSNDVYMVYDTAVVETWFNPAITTDCQIYICETGRTYNIITQPENINMRHQFVQFKVENVGGKT
jgi:hypothetical protein